jgi:hypothetical protein
VLSAAKLYRDRVNFVGVGALGNTDEMQVFVKDTGIDTFINLDDSSGKIWNRFGVVIQPTLIFIDAKGRITSHVGPSDGDFIAAKVKALAASK